MIVHCPSCLCRFDVQERILLPSGKKLKCSQCKGVFFQAPPPVAGADDVDIFSAATTVDFKGEKPSPGKVPPPAKITPLQPPKDSVFEGAMDLDDFAEEGEGDETRLSDDELRSLMGGDDEEPLPWDDEDAISEDMGISTETLMALEQEEAKLAQTPPKKPPAADLGKTMMAALEEAYPDQPEEEEEEDNKKLLKSFAAEEVDPPDMEEMTTLMAGRPPRKNKPPVKEKPAAVLKAPPKKMDLMEPDFDALLDEQSMDMDEIDLDADTYVAARDSTRLPMGLSGDEEDALSSLGFNPGLSHAEEDALGSLGFGGDGDIGGLGDDGDDMIPVQARDPAPPPSATKGSAYAGQKKKSLTPLVWTLVILLSFGLVGSVFYTRTGMREWMEYKLFDMDNSFRVITLESRWLEKEYGQVLVVEGTLRNTTNLTHTVPTVRVSLLDKDNNKLAETTVVPGRQLGEKDLEGSQDSLRTIIQMQSDTKRMKPQKLPPKKELTLQALFINPPENADRFQAEFEYLNQQTNRSGGTKTFQSVF